MITEGDVIVAQLPQADGGAKSRPVLLLKELPGFGDFLVCGISSQLQQAINGWDLPIPFGQGFIKGPNLERPGDLIPA